MQNQTILLFFTRIMWHWPSSQNFWRIHLVSLFQSGWYSSRAQSRHFVGLPSQWETMYFPGFKGKSYWTKDVKWVCKRSVNTYCKRWYSIFFGRRKSWYAIVLLGVWRPLPLSLILLLFLIGKTSKFWPDLVFPRHQLHSHHEMNEWTDGLFLKCVLHSIIN